MRFLLEMRSAGGAGSPADRPRTLSYRSRRMARIVATMAELGMVVEAGPGPKFPLWAVYGVSDFDAAGRAVGGRAGEYEAALADILGWHGNTVLPEIPAHKLRTNLGWLVTSEECGAAVLRFDRWRLYGRATPTVFGHDLLPFLRQAAQGAGFEVH